MPGIPAQIPQPGNYFNPDLMGKLWKPVIISLLVLTGCAGAHQIETELYFGLSKPGGLVSENEWNSFVEHGISPVLKEGFTIIPAQGKWLDESTHVLITEPSRLVVFVYSKNKSLSVRIDSLIASYKRQFQQQAVLRVDKKVTIHF